MAASVTTKPASCTGDSAWPRTTQPRAAPVIGAARPSSGGAAAGQPADAVEPEHERQRGADQTEVGEPGHVASAEGGRRPFHPDGGGTRSAPPSSSCQPVAASRFAGAGKRLVSTTPTAKERLAPAAASSPTGRCRRPAQDDQPDAEGSDEPDRHVDRPGRRAGHERREQRRRAAAGGRPRPRPHRRAAGTPRRRAAGRRAEVERRHGARAPPLGTPRPPREVRAPMARRARPAGTTRIAATSSGRPAGSSSVTVT